MSSEESDSDSDTNTNSNTNTDGSKTVDSWSAVESKKGTEFVKAYGLSQQVSETCICFHIEHALSLYLT